MTQAVKQIRTERQSAAQQSRPRTVEDALRLYAQSPARINVVALAEEFRKNPELDGRSGKAS